jgi:hypothetical protein
MEGKMEITAKLVKQGNGYGFRVPLPLITCKVIDPDKEYILVLKEKDAVTQISSGNPSTTLNDFLLNDDDQGVQV